MRHIGMNTILLTLLTSTSSRATMQMRYDKYQDTIQPWSTLCGELLCNEIDRIQIKHEIYIDTIDESWPFSLSSVSDNSPINFAAPSPPSFPYFQ